MTQALVQVLLDIAPGHQVDLVAPDWATSLVARMPGVSQGWALAARHGELGLAMRWQLGRKLRHEGYTRAIVVPRSFKSALLPWFAGIPQRTGFATEMRFGVLNDRRPLDRSRLDQTVKRLIALGLPAGAPLPPAPEPRLERDDRNLERLRAAIPQLAAGPLVALLPGAAHGPAKQWPIGHFAVLASRLAAAGAMILVMGSAGERALGEAILTAAPERVVNLCGRTTLGDAADLLSIARVAVSNDSGLMHVAAAAGAHVCGLYGSSSPRFTPPLTPRRTIFWLGLDCSPCFERTCPLGHLRCLRELSPDEVWLAVEPLLADSAA
ncbi:MAG: lipopolysaccharide heptosyltransferase II [Chromatiales bacterium]|nr:lipopolysaccharide heptosyltransferase II [Chromatiales bacterium]